MSNIYKAFELIEKSFFEPPPTTSIFPSKPLIPFFPSPCESDEFALATLDFLNPKPSDFVTDLIHIETTPFCSYKRLICRRQVDSSELYLQALCDRVSALESKFERLGAEKKKGKEGKDKVKKLNEVDRKYTWTAEIKGGVNRKYKLTTEIEGDDEKNGKKGGRSYEWKTEIKGKDDENRVYTWKADIGGEKNKIKKKEIKKNKNGKESCGNGARIVEIDEPETYHRDVVLRQAFTKRAVSAKGKEKCRDISPEDAAAMIQMTFKAYLIRRSQALRALRELAVAKTKLKELRALFHNYSYRSHVARDPEERQKFSERIIVLLLTVDGIEGVDVMVRAAKRSMVDELEAMLDVIDPQPTGKSLSMRRRTFDMPSGDIQKEIAEGVAQVVEMLDREGETFE